MYVPAGDTAAYILHARSPDAIRSANELLISSGDPKNAFLEQLDGAPENLRLFKADMLDYASLTAAFAGCEGVFHVASPVPEGRLVDPEASGHHLFHILLLLY
jgi:hypothetical protein